MDPSYIVNNLEEIPSPSLLIYEDRVQSNIERMLQMAGGPNYLRPHVKTHKMARVIEMKLKAGISKFKCATLKEARMIAAAGGSDVFIAYQLVGPNIPRLLDLMGEYRLAND